MICAPNRRRKSRLRQSVVVATVLDSGSLTFAPYRTSVLTFFRHSAILFFKTSHGGKAMTNRWGKYIQSAIVLAGIAATISMLWRVPVKNFPTDSFKVELSAEPQALAADTPVKLILAIKDGSGALVSDLEIVHEKPIHLIVVSDDLSFFDHIHPQLAPDGRYTVETSFPSGGAYKLYASYTPEGAEAQVSDLKVDVAGRPRERVALVPDTQDTKPAGDLLLVTLRPDKTLVSGKPVMLRFAVTDARTGTSAVGDLQPYLGALAHFVIISQDTSQFLHAHPTVESDSAAQPNPEVAAQTVFLKPGLYKVWAQFQRNQRVETVDFVLNVQPDPTPPASAEIREGGQEIRVSVGAGVYEPRVLKLKRGLPARITFYRADQNNCADEVLIRDFNIRKSLPAGEAVTIEFTPEREGEYGFTCGMSMLRGTLVVD